MDLLPLPATAIENLQNRGVPAPVFGAIQIVLSCLHEACATVADDTGIDRFDDSTSQGQLRWRRSRNRILAYLAADNACGVEPDTSDNALGLHVAGTCVSFYSARDGVHHPDLSGGSKTKRRVVTEMQLLLFGANVDDVPHRLVIVYEADRDGLARAGVGVLLTPREWAWQVQIFLRADLAGFGDHGLLAPPAYDEQPEPEVPEIELRDDADLPYDERPEPEIGEIDFLGEDGTADGSAE